MYRRLYLAGPRRAQGYTVANHGRDRGYGHDHVHDPRLDGDRDDGLGPHGPVDDDEDRGRARQPPSSGSRVSENLRERQLAPP
jgi:hypothetical protein